MSNTRILKNSAILYIRLLITVALGLYTVRVVINALGIEDYGIYSVVAGLVIMFGFMNAAMSSSTQRYLSFDLGLKDTEKLQKTFSTAINIHLLIGMLSFLLAEVVGVWAINHLLDIPADRLAAANTVFQFTLIVFTLGIIQVPYHAATIAYERMNVYAYISIVDAVLKLVSAYFLLSAPLDRLVLYSQLLAAISFLSFVSYFIYVQVQIKEIKYIKYFEKNYYKEILSFSGWNLFGNIASVARSQGINILINIFFGVTLNAAYALAIMIQGVLTQFASSIQQAINPQIIKSYAQNDKKRTEQLMHISSKFSFYVMLILVVPFYMNLDYVLGLWLGVVPEYAAEFIAYMLIFILIEVLSNSLMTGLQATGNIKLYHLTVGGVVFLNFPIVYLVYKFYEVPEMAFIVLIGISVLSLYVRLLFVKKQMGYMLSSFYRGVIFYISMVLILSVPVLFFVSSLNTHIGMLKVVSDVVLCTTVFVIIMYFIGMNINEKEFILKILKEKIFRNGTN
ncbi:MAG: hypothetical protein U9N57_02370 [Pseudomonadota bacterium]|nr:hypothetical protein [Pseudomonadota bacterium]